MRKKSGVGDWQTETRRRNVLGYWQKMGGGKEWCERCKVKRAKVELQWMQGGGGMEDKQGRVSV